MSNFLSYMKSIIRAIRPSYQSKAEYKPLSDHPVSIKDYVKHSIVAGVESGSGPEWDLLWKYRVMCLDHCKHLDSDKHEREDIVALVVDDEGNTFRILIERCEYTNDAAETCGQDDDNPACGTSPKILPSTLKRNTESFVSHPIDALLNPNNDNPQLKSSPKLFPANDIIRTLPLDYEDTGQLVVLRIFEPRPKSLFLVRLGMIIEAVHDFMPHYEDFRGQSRWFAVTVMAVSMLQGGAAKVIFGENSRLLYQKFVYYDSELPRMLGLADSEDERPHDRLSRALIDLISAGENSKLPSYQDILTIGDESQQRLDSLDSDVTPERADYMRPRLAEARDHPLRTSTQELWEELQAMINDQWRI